MAEDLIINGTNKKEKYESLLPQLQALVDGETDVIANIGNVIAGIKQAFDFLWIGIYHVKGNQLVLGPFQGPVACTRIAFGKGVCGKSWETKQTIVVPDVEKFPGHIACSSASKSEIVLPGFDNEKNVLFVLDVDSDQLNTFDNTDQQYLQQVVTLIEKIIL